MKLMVLRKVSGLSEGVVDLINKQDGFYGDTSGPELFVDNDYPRDSAVAYELLEKTVGFAVASPDGEILKEFEGDHAGALHAAESAARSAKIVFSVEVGLDDDAADPAAPVARRPEPVSA